MKPTAPTRKLQSDYSIVDSRPKTPKTAKIRFFDRNLREGKLSFQPDQPGGNFFWVTTKLFAEKKIHSNRTFFLFHSVISSISLKFYYHMKECPRRILVLLHLFLKLVIDVISAVQNTVLDNFFIICMISHRNAEKRIVLILKSTFMDILCHSFS